MAEARFIDEEPIDGTSQVVKVWDATFQLPRAVRILPMMGPDDGAVVRERVRMLSGVRHPALPPLVAVGEVEGAVQLVESWVEGESLAARLEREGQVLLSRGLALLSPIVDALRSAHDLGIGHGGVDARSVLVDQVGVPQLVGMGAREGTPADDVSDLGFLMTELIAEPWPDTMRSMVAEATAGQLSSLADLSERLRLISLDLPDETDDLEFDFDFDFEFDPNEIVYDEAAVASDRRVLALVALGVIAIIGVGIYGTTMPDEPTPVEQLAEVADAVDASDDEAATPASDGPPDEVAEAAKGADEAAPDAVATAEAPPASAVGAVEVGASEDPEGPDARVLTGGAIGKWRVQRATEAPAMAVLDAENEVEDRLDQSGRPQLAWVCGDDGLLAELRPGVHRVEATADERTYDLFVMLEVSRDGEPADPIRARLVHGDGHVYLPVDRLRALADVDSVMLRYPPFAGNPVAALFDVRGMRAAMDHLGWCG